MRNPFCPQFFARFFPLLCALALSACQSLPGPASQAPHSRLAAAYFVLEGRVAVRGESGQASARLRWQHERGAHDVWTLSSPLGQVLARLSRNRAGAEYELADGRRLADRDVDRLFARLLGVAVPVAALSDWVQGVVRPSARLLESDALGRAQKISDAGWLIHYQAYASDAPDAALRRLQVERGEKRLRLVIDQWQAR